MKTRMQPLGDRVVVSRLDAEEKTPGGLFIPDQAKEKPSKGIVLAVGPGRRNKDGSRVALDVKVGDKVLFGKYSGAEIEEGGEKIVVLREEDILAVLT